MVGADRHAALHHEGNAGDAEREAERLAPRHALAQERRRHDGDEHRVGADHHRGKPGRDALQADIAQAQIRRLIRDAERGEQQELATAEPQRHAGDNRRAEHEHAGEQEAHRQQQQRRTVRDGELGDGKRRRPQQAERRHHERKRQPQARHRGGWRGDGSGTHG
jgi:hypothetical protein